LAKFCTAAKQGPYAWWQADAGVGKSALLSWFVLNPPPGVRVVSFFATTRYARQGDRAAFIDVVLEQLAELLGESMPAHLTRATGEAHLLGTLRMAAQACQRQGQRLVLVVDGLDQDSGVREAGIVQHRRAAARPARRRNADHSGRTADGDSRRRARRASATRPRRRAGPAPARVHGRAGETGGPPLGQGKGAPATLGRAASARRAGAAGEGGT
jgi:hypothetical protein